jgi:flagellar L-ring protein precursor FlgH
MPSFKGRQPSISLAIDRQRRNSIMKKFAPLAIGMLLVGYPVAGQAKSSKLTKAETPVTPTVVPSIAQQGQEERRGNVAVLTQPSASLFRSGASGFFRDQRASRVGDIVTIKINISDSATVGNSTSRTRDGSDKSGVTGLFGLEKLLPPSLDPGSLLGTNSGSKTAGTGNIARSEKVDMTVAAVVANVLPNGNLVIRGSQEVRVNSELRELTVTGFIRPEDIARDNSVLHTQIADARISYGGRGQLSDAQKMRWGQKVIDAVSPF